VADADIRTIATTGIKELERPVPEFGGRTSIDVTVVHNLIDRKSSFKIAKSENLPLGVAYHFKTAWYDVYPMLFPTDYVLN
jgi:hypothetical protein